jgi:hypothetical protein
VHASAHPTATDGALAKGPSLRKLTGLAIKGKLRKHGFQDEIKCGIKSYALYVTK